MKNLKRLVAVALTIVMVCALSTVAFAANLSVRDQDNYTVFVTPATITQGTTEFTVGIGIKDTRDGETLNIVQASGSQVNLLLYNSVQATLDAGIEIKSISSNLVDVGTYGENYLYGTAEEGMDGAFGLMMTPFVADNTALTDETPIFTITCSINEDAAVGTYTIAKGEYSQADLNDGNGEGASAVMPETYDLVTVTAAQAAEEEVDATVISQGKETVNGKDNSYWGVWVGRYSVSAGTKTLKKVVVTFDGDTRNKEYAKDGLSITGDGTVNFEVAILGVPDEFQTASKAVATLQ